jgi:hypothetical protein
VSSRAHFLIQLFERTKMSLPSARLRLYWSLNFQPESVLLFSDHTTSLDACMSTNSSTRSYMRISGFPILPSSFGMVDALMTGSLTTSWGRAQRFLIYYEKRLCKSHRSWELPPLWRLFPLSLFFVNMISHIEFCQPDDLAGAEVGLHNHIHIHILRFCSLLVSMVMM